MSVDLNNYLVVGIWIDYESIIVKEVIDCLCVGMFVMLCEGIVGCDLF